MSKVTRVKSLSELARVLKRDLRKKQQRIDRAAKRAASRHQSYLMRHMPVAFGELRASVHVEGTKVVVDAPHAAAVERGSRPHWMPLEPLIKWVKLRGFQGLASSKSQSRLPGSTTQSHAGRVRAALDAHSADSEWAGDASDMQGPVAVAKAIQIAIAQRGTKPTWFMRNSIPVARGFLREEIGRAMGE